MQHTNHLINETSPYLLQHAHNPVDWYPWGEEALQKAVKEDKPILVSIGYSACHWCHVMERESFEDESTASIMNERFINIKIDREERPDLDHIYMDAVQAIAGNGGWPLNVFLTPEGKPFFGGTYFPPERMYNRLSWKELLVRMSTLFTEERPKIESQADELIRHISASGTQLIKPMNSNFAGEESFTRSDADMIFSLILKQSDTEWGGFGQAPKFPQTFVINYLLRYYYYTGNKDALKQACLSLDKMIQGGIYDQLGGGFARYSTDREWLAPHFEKMLYDNALLISTMTDAYRLTGDKAYERAIRQTVDFIKRELMDRSGCFYSALDADSEGEEGKFYVWTEEEIREILGDKAALFCSFYDVSPGGNWEHKNILRTLISTEVFASKHNIPEADLLNTLDYSRKALIEARNLRIRPGLDDKILVGWNALLITALCKAAGAFNEKEYSTIAVNSFAVLWATCRKGETYSFYHTIKNGIAKYPAFLDDYACLAEACINLQEVTSEQIYLEHARGLCEFVDANFSSENGHYYFTGKFQDDIVVRKIEIYDGATPSGNSIMTYCLGYLGIIFDNQHWKEAASINISAIKHMIEKYPSSFGVWACLLLDNLYGNYEIVITGKNVGEARSKVLQEFIPNKIFQCSTKAEEQQNYPFFQGKSSGLKPLLYICKNYACQVPIENIASGINEMLRSKK